jgi:transcriptional regulator with GAF, ATPase, and Fis domain
VNKSHSVLNDIAQQVQEIVQAETAVVALAEDEGATVYYAAAVGKHTEQILDRRGAAATSGLCGTAFQGYQPVLVCSTQGDHRVRQDQAQALGIQTALAVPLYHENQLLGALMALNRTDSSLFDEEAEQVLADYAPEAASLIHQYQTCVE